MVATTSTGSGRVPNALSLLRLAGVPLVVWLILGPQADVLAAAVLVVAGFTDWLDGYLARAWHQRSRLGQLLDPVADRLYILAIIGGLAIRGIIPWWLVIVLAARDVMIALLVPLLQHPRLLRAAGALPGQGRDVLPAVRLPAGAARRRRRHRGDWSPGWSAGRSRCGGPAVLVGRHALRRQTMAQRAHPVGSARSDRPVATAGHRRRDASGSRRPTPAATRAREHGSAQRDHRQPIDPDYARRRRPGAMRAGRGGRWALTLVAVLIGTLFAVGAVQTTRAAPRRWRPSGPS